MVRGGRRCVGGEGGRFGIGGDGVGGGRGRDEGGGSGARDEHGVGGREGLRGGGGPERFVAEHFDHVARVVDAVFEHAVEPFLDVREVSVMLNGKLASFFFLNERENK